MTNDKEPIVPILLGDPLDAEYFSAKDYVEYINKLHKLDVKDIPKFCILTFHEEYSAKVKDLYGKPEKEIWKLKIYKSNKLRFGEKRIGIGGSCACSYVEDLIALGVKYFIAIGCAGSLQEYLEIGSIVVPDKAIRDEGTSYHYQKPSKYSFPSELLLDPIKEYLKEECSECYYGPTWTTDAPYRETTPKLTGYRKEGVLTVEMEAASLFAMAKMRKVSMASILIVSDILTGKKWSPHFHSDKYKNKIEDVIKIAVEAFRKLADSV